MTFGIDVSNWNHVTSWQDAKNGGVELGISKATEGLNYTDPTFRDNWAGSSIMTERASYHFGHPRNDPIQEATHYLSVATFGDRDWPMLDMETTDGLGYAHAADWSNQFCNYVRDRTGKLPLFYSYYSFIQSMGAAANVLTQFPLFIAAYQSNPPVVSPWSKWTIWQNTSQGHVAGIVGEVDMDQLSADALAMFAPSNRPTSGGKVALNKPVSAIAYSAIGQGYWLAAQDGGVFAYGVADHGNLPGLHVTPSAPIVGIAGTPDDGGYWLVGADGGIFAFGNAQFFGSMGGHHLNQPIVGMVASRDGLGYALVAADGAVFAYGDVPFKGAVA